MNRILAISSFLTISIFLISPTISLKLHGDPCHKKKDCDVSSGLTCFKSFCQCSRPESTVYSETIKACLIRIGRRCDEASTGGGGGGGRNATDADLNLADETGGTTTQTSSSSLGMTCIENAECKKLRARHWCQCHDGYVANADGTECRAMAKYGEFCDEDDDQCDKSTGTVCIDGNCQCPFSDQYFDQHEGVCKSFAGGNCSVPKMSPCVPNADCTSAQVRMGYTTEKGVKKIHTKTVVQCLCKIGYSQTSNGYCFGAFETSCSSKLPCNSEDYLACVDGKCKCRNPLHEVINENTGQCVSLVGTTCHRGKGPQCVENAECVDGKCECVSGYTVTPARACRLGYKEPCHPNQCNGFNGLACVKGRCDCFDSFLLYDTSTKACIALSSSSDE